VTAFAHALGRFGWVEGKNVRIDYRFAAGVPTRFDTYAAELVGLSPNVLLAGNTPAAVALRQQTRTIPIVFVLVADPIGLGFVQSFARPGGDMTGFSSFDPLILGKWLQLLSRSRPCHTGRRYLQPGHRALRPIGQPRDRIRSPVLRDDGDTCTGSRRRRYRRSHRRSGARARRRPDHLAGQF
jgi:hypothetical protein